MSDTDVPVDAPDTIDGVTREQLRSTLGHFATGVVVITASGPTGPVGMAVNSFTSVSLDPPLVLFCAATTSTTWPHVKAAGAFCVNVLTADQEHLARGFAGSGDRYHGVTHRRGRSGAAILDGVLAYVDCEIYAEYPAGDHVLVLGKVLDLASVPGSEPLVFFRSAYRRLGGPHGSPAAVGLSTLTLDDAWLPASATRPGPSPAPPTTAGRTTC